MPGSGKKQEDAALTNLARALGDSQFSRNEAKNQEESISKTVSEIRACVLADQALNTRVLSPLSPHSQEEQADST